MFFFLAGAGGCPALLGPEWWQGMYPFTFPRTLLASAESEENQTIIRAPPLRGGEAWREGGGESRFAMYTEVHCKTGRARTDFLASNFPRAQEAPRCRDSFAGRRSPSGKIVPDSHSHGHPRVGCTLIVPSSIKWALLQSSYASPGSFSEIRDCENVHTCGCFTVTDFRE